MERKLIMIDLCADSFPFGVYIKDEFPFNLVLQNFETQ
jgi:hypothetical protein